MRGSHVTGSDLGERSKSLWWEEDEAGAEYGAWRHCPSLKRHDDKSGNWHRQRKAHGACIIGWVEPLFKTLTHFSMLGQRPDHITKQVKVAQSCPTLCDPMDCTVHGILQARILEWVAFPFQGDLPNPGIEPRSPALQVDALPAKQ